MIDKIKIFAVNMKRKREELKKTQRGLALEVGVTPATISAYEKQIKFPSLENALAICEALGCTLDEMCGVEKETITDDMRLISYTHILNMIIAQTDILRGYIAHCNVHMPNGESSEGFTLYYTNPIIQKFLEEWEKVRILYQTNTIDNELYTAWIEKKMREYDKPFESDTENEHIMNREAHQGENNVNDNET